MPKFDGFAFYIGMKRRIHADLGVIAVLAAQRKISPKTPVQACVGCWTICCPCSLCSCCNYAPDRKSQAAGERSGSGDAEHRQIPYMQIDAAIAQAYKAMGGAA